MANKLNVKLLAKVRDKIRATPEAYKQSVWGEKSSEAPCGTRACIAGWGFILSGVATPEQVRAERYAPGKSINFISEGAELFGIGKDEAEVLFCGDASRWAEPFEERWANAASKAERANVAADYLDHIIATGEIGGHDDYDDDEDDDDYYDDY